MPRSIERIRDTMIVKRTPQDKGLTTTISLVAYDTGIIEVNGTPVRGLNNWPMVIKVVDDTVNEFRAQVERGKH